jgi:hypothetical protein
MAKVVDIYVDEVIEREETPEETAAREELAANIEAAKQAENDRAALVASRQAKLQALGLTEEELNA